MIKAFLFFLGLFAGILFGRFTSPSEADWIFLILFMIAVMIMYWKDYLTKLIAYYKDEYDD